jgi:CspA family cold shock protein
MAKGTVKWFSPEKGYGFISSETGEDLFVHFSEIQGDGFKTLEDGAPVEFDIVDGKNGKKQAGKVHTI